MMPCNFYIIRQLFEPKIPTCDTTHYMWKLLLPLFLCSQLYASRVSILINDNENAETPAKDLMYQGENIDAIRAFELKNAGLDLSTLNPRQSNLWNDENLAAHNYDEINYPQVSETFKFVKYKASPTEFFRAQIKDSTNKDWTLMGSLDNHTNIIRAALLRQIGFQLDTPKIYKELKIQFESNEQRDEFLASLGEGTLTSRDRWVKEKNEKELILKDLIIEPAELRNVNIHLPLMTRERQRERRIFRSLLAIYIITDFPQSVNSIEWSKGRIFNDSLLFNHPYASQFANTTIDDLRWIMQRLNDLTPEEISKSTSLAGYPFDIEKLVNEKLLARINSINKLLSLENEYAVDKKISVGNVIDGELKNDAYSNEYVVDFYQEDEESPYSFKQLFKLFRTQAVYSSISGLMDLAIEKFTPGLRVNDAIENIQEEIQAYNEANTVDGVAPSRLPLKTYTEPILNGRVFATRNVIFGQYLGSNAPIQLVDTVGGEVNLGVFGNITGIAQAMIPSFGANAILSRTYTHVRAMPDLATATTQKIKKILVPMHLKKLGRVINDEFNCSIPSDVFVEEETIDDRTVKIIKYDKNLENGFQKALAKRRELEEAGDQGPFLLRQIDREQLCVSEVVDARKKNLKEFVDQFALNETFIINDSVRLATSQNIPIPLQSVSPNLSVSIGSDQSVSLLRSIVIRKVADGIEITFQSQRDISAMISERLSYFLEIMSNSTSWTKGKLFSKVYKIKLEGIDSEEQEKALLTLRHSIVNNNHERLRNDYRATELDHDIKSRLNTFRFLFFKSERLKMDHEVRITIPNKPGENYSEEIRTRSLYGVSDYKRSGNDFYSFFDRIISSFTNFFGLGQSNQDPGRSFFGTSKKLYVTTEGELTERYDLNPITRVEYKWTGWNKKVRKMNRIFDDVEEFFEGITNTDIIDRSILDGTNKVRSYDVSTTFIIYPSAFDNLQDQLFSKNEIETINYLYYAYGESEWQRYCRRVNDFFGTNGPQNYRGENGKYYQCVPPDVKKLLRLRKVGLPSERKARLKEMKNTIKTLFTEFKVSNVLRLLGIKNFFATTRVSGFRENHHEGFLDYISNSVGTYQPKYGTGTFDMLSQQLGLSVYELRALMYTPGM